MKINRRLGMVAAMAMAAGALAGRAAPAPASGVTAADRPWDGGDALVVSWQKSPDDAQLKAYKVERSMSKGEVEHADADDAAKAVALAKKEATAKALEGTGLEVGATLPPDVAQRVREARAAAAAAAEAAAKAEVAGKDKDRFQFVAFTAPGETTLDVDGLSRNEPYRFRVLAQAQDGSESAAAESAAPVAPTRQPFDGGRLPLAVIATLICGSVVGYIQLARGGIKLNVRRIPGLDAVTEAVGRATEMGRPVLFVPGTQDMNDIQTIAGLTVLSHVARTAAEYDAKVEVPTSRSLVMTAARETVQASFLSAARPDAYNESLIYYVTDEQFGYVAYLSGMMVREKPATCFYMGAFFAESLILAETGNAIGAIQIAGTAQPAQLPFFVAACDYTLIGEEFFAASAYLSGAPEQIGSLKGQDVGKAIVAAVMVFGVAMATAGVVLHSPTLAHWVSYLRGTILS